MWNAIILAFLSCLFCFWFYILGHITKYKMVAANQLAKGHGIYNLHITEVLKKDVINGK